MNSKTAITVIMAGLVLIGVIGLIVLSPAAPPQNQTPSNQNTTSSMLRVTAPQPGAHVTSPVRIVGEARGIWFFEASFPVKIFDGDGTLLGIEPAQAQGEWMTEDFVPFEVTIAFSKPKFATGTIVLQKDNPSGLLEHDAEVRIPIVFGPAVFSILSPKQNEVWEIDSSHKIEWVYAPVALEGAISFSVRIEEIAGASGGLVVKKEGNLEKFTSYVWKVGDVSCELGRACQDPGLIPGRTYVLDFCIGTKEDLFAKCNGVAPITIGSPLRS